MDRLLNLKIFITRFRLLLCLSLFSQKALTNGYISFGCLFLFSFFGWYSFGSQFEWMRENGGNIHHQIKGFISLLSLSLLFFVPFLWNSFRNIQSSNEKYFRFWKSFLLSQAIFIVEIFLLLSLSHPFFFCQETAKR